MTNSPTSPTGIAVTPSSRLIILQSTSERGNPIEPVRFSPYTGLQCVAVGASDSPYPSTNLPPVRASNLSFVSRISGAEPEIHALIELRLYFPALASGLLLIALYMVGTPGKIVALYFWRFPSTSARSRGVGIITIAHPAEIA